TLDQYPNLYREFSSEDFDYYGINDETLCPLCKLDHDDEEGIDEKGNISKSNKILTPEYLDWHAKLTGLPSVLTDRIRSSLYKKYKKETGFRGIDNYDFTSPQPWSSPCPICDGKHGNYGLHGEWYGTEYCLTCFTSSNKFKFAIVA
ncbi:hypothetical protein RhiirB3_450879, partial [Rhizophagus irregularis]